MKNQFDPSSNMPAVPGSDPALPMGENTQGMTPGSLVYAKASDLDKGFVAADGWDKQPSDFCGDGLQDTDRKPDPTGSPFDGFLGRPQGWQR